MEENYDLESTKIFQSEGGKIVRSIFEFQFPYFCRSFNEILLEFQLSSE